MVCDEKARVDAIIASRDVDKLIDLVNHQRNIIANISNDLEDGSWPIKAKNKQKQNSAMKPFSYYDKIIMSEFDENNFNYTPEEQAMLDEIEKESLTKEQRSEKIQHVRDINRDRWLKQEKDLFDNQDKMWDEFWLDCRKALGYDKFLTKDGVEAIENIAISKATLGGGWEHADKFLGTEKCYEILKGFFSFSKGD